MRKMTEIRWDVKEGKFTKDISFQRVMLTEASFKREIDKELARMKKPKYGEEWDSSEESD